MICMLLRFIMQVDKQYIAAAGYPKQYVIFGSQIMYMAFKLRHSSECFPFADR